MTSTRLSSSSTGKPQGCLQSIDPEEKYPRIQEKLWGGSLWSPSYLVHNGQDLNTPKYRYKLAC